MHRSMVLGVYISFLPLFLKKSGTVSSVLMFPCTLMKLFLTAGFGTTTRRACTQPPRGITGFLILAVAGTLTKIGVGFGILVSLQKSSSSSGSVSIRPSPQMTFAFIVV